jgi:hypothetical protein
MDAKGYAQCTPRNDDPSVGEEPWLDFSSGYVQRTIAKFPKQGSKTPWKLYQNYARDIMALRYGRLEDGVMRFEKRPAAPKAAAAEPMREAAE